MSRKRLSHTGLYLILSCLVGQGIPFEQLFAQSVIYTYEDLQTLYQQKNSAEFFQHARDLRPKERTTAWKKMALDLLEQMLKEEKLKLPLNTEKSKQIATLLDWPELQDQEKTSYLRGVYTRYLLLQCSGKEGDTQCLQEIQQQWPKLATNPERGDIGVELLRRFLRTDNQEYPFFTEVLQGLTVASASDIYCKKEEVQDFLFRQLQYTFKTSSTALSKNPWWQKNCLLGMELFLKEKMMGGMLLEDHYLAFQILRDLKRLTALEISAYYVSFLLYGPIVGDDFNHAWNTLTKMKESFSFRQNVFIELKKYALLPGAIFASPDRQKRKIIVDHLLQAFPEYVDYYLETCHHYYRGSKKFPYGNPVPHCSEVMETLSTLSVKERSASRFYSKLRQLPKFQGAENNFPSPEKN